jgi:hypothetical protein
MNKLNIIDIVRKIESLQEEYEKNNKNETLIDINNLSKLLTKEIDIKNEEEISKFWKDLYTRSSENICKRLNAHKGYTEHEDIKYTYYDKNNIIGFIMRTDLDDFHDNSIMKYTKFGSRLMLNLDSGELLNNNMTINDLDLSYDIYKFFKDAYNEYHSS